ncbi:MAG: short-chain dehydrogenase [Hyphomonadaceae bacterium BRH_c29]|nr:MAG: short-chain dehydrogenase [Hyphomonadaceae bacterium BRH_c29]
MRLAGKTAIVTGASSGIGRAAARRFAAEGAFVVLGARRAAELTELVEQIRAAGGQAVSVAGDVKSPEQNAALAQVALNETGRLDIAFNNAGIIGDGIAIEDMDRSNWHNVIATNLTSAFLASQSQIPAMRKQGSGSLIFTSSFVGHTVGLPGMGAYAASKAGLIGLAQVLAVELGEAGIRANALLPGGTRTGMMSGGPDMEAAVAGLHALKRIAEPEEIANAALFLASDESRFVTGSAMLVDGGNSIAKA